MNLIEMCIVLWLNAETGERELLVWFKLKYPKLKRKNTKYREYTEGPNVFSKERLRRADSAGGHDSSPNTTFSSFKETFTSFFFHVSPSQSEPYLGWNKKDRSEDDISAGFSGIKRWKWRQTLLGDVLHKGVWWWQHLSEGIWIRRRPAQDI